MCNFCILFDFSTARAKVDHGVATIEKAPEMIPFLPKDRFNFCPVCGSPLTEDYSVGRAFPARLRKVRRLRGYTQEALGREIGVKRSAICKYEKGRTKPNIKQLASICKILEVSPQELI